MATRIGSATVSLGTWSDIEFAAEQGLINERTHCELKKGLPPASQNAELARDLASMTVEGGVLIYGVTDVGRGVAGAVVGIEEAESARTRLIGVAQASVQPSAACEVSTISNPADSERACVVVVVPPSPVAPHRADERYWGRSAEGKRVLSDAEVADLFSRRRNRDDRFSDQLVALEDFDPIPPLEQREGHLYFSAEPLQGNGQPPPWAHDEHPLQVVVGAKLPPTGWGGASLSSLTYRETHPRGIAAVSRMPGDAADQEDYSLRLLLDDNGGVRYASGLGTRTRSLSRTGGDPVRMIMTGAVLSQVDHCVRLTSNIADRRGDAGIWRLGVRMTGLKGVASVDQFSEMSLDNPRPYPEPELLEVSDATASELRDSPEEVVERLMYPLTRGLGLESRFFPYDTPASFFRR